MKSVTRGMISIGYSDYLRYDKFNSETVYRSTGLNTVTAKI